MHDDVIVKPRLGFWTPGWMAKLAANKLWEYVHGIPSPHFMVFMGGLWVKHIRHDGWVKNYGLVGRRAVCDDWVEDVVDNLIAEVAAFGDYKYHQSGTNATGAAATDTVSTLDTTSFPAPVAGTQVENAANIYESVATVNYTGTLAVEEHGIGNNATWLSGILLDRHTFTVINVVNGDSIEFTYRLTCTAGG